MLPIGGKCARFTYHSHCKRTAIAFYVYLFHGYLTTFRSCIGSLRRGITGGLEGRLFGHRMIPRRIRRRRILDCRCSPVQFSSMRSPSGQKHPSLSRRREASLRHEPVNLVVQVLHCAYGAISTSTRSSFASIPRPDVFQKRIDSSHLLTSLLCDASR